MASLKDPVTVLCNLQLLKGEVSNLVNIAQMLRNSHSRLEYAYGRTGVVKEAQDALRALDKRIASIDSLIKHTMESQS